MSSERETRTRGTVARSADRRWISLASVSVLAAAILSAPLVAPLGDASPRAVSGWGTPVDDVVASTLAPSPSTNAPQTLRLGAWPTGEATRAMRVRHGQLVLVRVDVADPRLGQRFSRWTL